MPDPNTPVAGLKNLGPKSKEWLHGIGVYTLGDIERTGIPEIYHQLKAQGRPANANLLYALQGALMGIHWNEVPLDLREELRQAVARPRR